MFDFRQIRFAIYCLFCLLVPLHAAAQSVLESGAHQDFQLAAGLYQRGDWDESVSAFEGIINDHDGTHDADVAHFFLGEALMQRQEFKKAYVAWQNYLLRLPHDEFASRATFRMGEAAMRMGQTTQAIHLLEKFVDQYPADALMQFALAYLGEMRLMRQEPQLAQRVFEMALRIQPDGHIANRCRFGLAKSLQIQGNFSDALNFYDFIIREPNNPLGDVARLESGIIYFGAAQYDEATELLTPIVESLDAVTTSETVAKANYWLGRIALTNDRFFEAVDHFKQMEAGNVESDIVVAAWYDGAIAATNAGDHNQSEQWLTQLIDQYPNHSLADDSQFMRVRNAFLRANYSSVPRLAKEFTTRYAQSPFQNQVNEFLGQVAYQDDNYDQTVEIFSTLLDTRPSPDNSDRAQRLTWSYYLALGHLGLNEFKQAENILQALATSDELVVGNKPESLSTLVQVALATARFSQNRFEASIANYENYLSVVDRNSDAQQSQLELTIAYAYAGRWEDARESYKKWNSQSPAETSVSETLRLLVSIARGETDGAETEYWLAKMTSAITHGDTSATGLSELAWIKMERGDTAGANLLFDQLLVKFPTHSLAAKAGIARAKNLEDVGQYQEAASTYALIGENFADQPTGKVAQLRQAYALQKAGASDSLQLAKTTIDKWIANARKEKDTDQKLLAEAIYQAGWICEDLGDQSERQRRFQQLVNQFPDSKYWPDAAYRVARQLVAARKFEQASELLEKLQGSKRSPERIVDRSTFLRGQIRSRQERWADAEKIFERLATSTADQSLKNKSEYWLAESLYRRGKFASARQYFGRLYGSNAAELKSLRPWIALRLAQSFAKLEKWQDAAEVSRAALQEFASFSLAHEFDFLVARGMEDVGQMKDAIKGYQKVVDSHRGGATETAAIAQWRIGEIHFHQEHYPDAIKAYYRVDSIFGYPRWRSAALLQAAKCQEHLKNWKHAEKLYRQLLELFPDEELADDARDRLAQLQAVATKEAPALKRNKQR